MKKELLSPGAVLEASVAGAGTYSATVLPDGYIEYAGASYKTPSGAGAAVKETAAGRSLAPKEKATDAWQFWRAWISRRLRSSSVTRAQRPLRSTFTSTWR